MAAQAICINLMLFIAYKNKTAERPVTIIAGIIMDKHPEFALFATPASLRIRIWFFTPFIICR